MEKVGVAAGIFIGHVPYGEATKSCPSNLRGPTCIIFGKYYNKIIFLIRLRRRKHLEPQNLKQIYPIIFCDGHVTISTVDSVLFNYGRGTIRKCLARSIRIFKHYL